MKQSRALRGRNPARDNQVEGAPIARVASGVTAGGRFYLVPYRTPESCLSKSIPAVRRSRFHYLWHYFATECQKAPTQFPEEPLIRALQ